MSNKKYKLLILEGGGIFGYIQASFLESINNNILNDIDFISGCSIGGINALMIASGSSPLKLKQFYYDYSKIIFKTTFFRKINPFLSKYSDKNIESVLKKELKGKFKDIKIPTIIPVVDFKNEKPKIFDNMINDEDLLFNNWEIGRMTSAAPTYFPPYGKNQNQIFIDGGINEVCPIITAATAIKNKLNINYNDIDVLVIGTGQNTIKKRKLNQVNKYTSLHWLNEFLIPYVTKSNKMSSIFWGKNLGFNSFTYFNPIKIDGEMDDINLVYDFILEKECEKYKDDFKIVWNNFIKNIS